MAGVLKQGERAAVVSALTSVFLLAIKAAAGFLTGSIALVSDALNSASDVVGMVTAWFGFRISQKKPDEKFTYGYYKAESLAAFLISLIIVYASAMLLMQGWSRLFVAGEIEMPAIALAAAAVSSIISLFLSRYLLATGKKINSQLLVITSRDRLGDCLSSAAVFAAVAASVYDMHYVEGAVSMLIALLILRLGIVSAKDSVFALMDVGPDKQQEQAVRGVIKSVKGVYGLKSLRLRKAGPFLMGDVVVKMKKTVSVAGAHAVADEIETLVMKQFSEIALFTVHVEPYKGTGHKIAIPVKSSNDLQSMSAGCFGEAAYILFASVSGNNCQNIHIMRNVHRKKYKHSGLSLVHLLEKEGADIVIVKRISEAQFHILKGHFIDIYKADGKTAQDVISQFISRGLTRLHQPDKQKPQI